MLERFLFLLLLIHEAPAPPRQKREEVMMEPPSQAQPDLPDLSGMFGGFNMFQPTNENDQNEATVETVEDNVVAVDDSLPDTPGAVNEENSDLIIEEVETNTFPSEVNGGQEIDDQVLQNLNLMPSFDTIGQQDNFGFGIIDNNLFNAFGDVDVSVNQDDSNSVQEDTIPPSDSPPLSTDDFGLGNMGNILTNGLENADVESNQGTVAEQESLPSSSSNEDTSSSDVNQNLFNLPNGIQQPSWDNSMNTVQNMPTQQWNQNNPGTYNYQYQYPTQQWPGNQQPNYYTYYQPNNYVSTHNYIVSPSQTYHAYNQGSGSQSWADVTSSSPTYSNVDVDAVYASQETDNQYGFWFDGSQTQSNFDPSSQNNYFDYYQGPSNWNYYPSYWYGSAGDQTWGSASGGQGSGSNWQDYGTGSYYNPGYGYGYDQYSNNYGWDSYYYGNYQSGNPGFARMGGSSSRNPHGGKSRDSGRGSYGENTVPKLVGKECFSPEGNHGHCVDNEVECGLAKGLASGTCSETAYSGRNKVCCVQSAKCKEMVHNQKGINLQSPGYPETINSLAPCPVTVLIQPKVCQVRIDFLDFNMGLMKNGVCDVLNSMLIQSSQSDAILPKTRFCGNITSDITDPLRTDVPHMYVHFPHTLGVDKRMIPSTDDFLRSLTFTFNVKEQMSKWNIRVTQIQCNGYESPLQAPDGCSQYYYERNGNIKSFNLPDGQYSTKTYMDVCIQKSPSDCGVTYEFKKLGLGKTRSGGLGYGIVCDDFIVFRGERTSMCGNGNGGIITLPAKGPVGFTFKSDRSSSEFEQGYSIDYYLLQDCSNTRLFNGYPKPSSKG